MRLTIVKAFAFLLWDMHAISEGFYVLVSAEIESISKQVTGWQKHLLGKNRENSGVSDPSNFSDDKEDEPDAKESTSE